MGRVIRVLPMDVDALESGHIEKVSHQVWVQWDNGSLLAVLVPIDKITRVGDDGHA